MATPYLDRIRLAAGQPQEYAPEWDPAPLLLAMEGALGGAYLALASDPDDDGDDDSSDKGDTDDDAGHTGHALFKKLTKRGMPDAAAAKACARADKKVKASALVGFADAAFVMLSVSQADRDKAHAANNSLPDKSYPINDTKQLHSAAVLAASHHGDWKAAQSLIRRRAKELGVDINSLPGFGDSGTEGEKVAASMVALAAAAPPEPVLGLDHSGVMNHGAFSGQHKHPHVVTAVHEHPHHHNMDSHHGHHPGVPGNRF